MNYLLPAKIVSLHACRNKFERFYHLLRALLIIFSLICTLCSGVVSAQNEMQFSGSFAMPVASNPAAAGRSGQVDFTGAFRQQWVGFSDAPTQILLAIDSEVKFLKNFHGVGVLVAQDRSGLFTILDIAANYSYHIYLDKGILGLGARFGMHNVKFDSSDLSTAPQSISDGYHQESDEAISGSEESKGAFDAGLGAFYQSDLSFLSLSVLHLTAPEVEFNQGSLFKVRPVLSFAAGRLFGQDVGNHAIEPRLSLRSDFASMQLEMSLNVNVHQRVWFGLGARIQDALLAGLGIHLRNGLDFAYGYDLCLSKLKRYNSGSHDVVVRYSFDFDSQKPSKRYKSVRIL